MSIRMKVHSKHVIITVQEYKVDLMQENLYLPIDMHKHVIITVNNEM